jgi:hypothetical protein
MDNVLGISITRVAAGLVLLDTDTPDDVGAHRDSIDLTGAHAALIDVMAAVLGIQGSVSAKGHRLGAVGVTWSAGSEAKARELVTTLTEFGLANTVAISPGEARRALPYNSKGPDTITAPPIVTGRDASIAAAEEEVRLAHRAALVLSRRAAAHLERTQSAGGERRRLNPSAVTSATILTGGILAIVSTWIGVAARDSDADVTPPVLQEQSVPPPLLIPSSRGATALPVTDSSLGAASPNTPMPLAPPVSQPLVPIAPQRPQHRLAGQAPATPPPEGQEPNPDGSPSPAQEPPVSEQAPPVSPEPGPDTQGPPPEESTHH